MPVLDFILQVAICRADKPEVDRFALGCAQWKDGMFLQDAQKFALQVEWHFSNFVQKESASIGCAYDALLVAGCSGERSLFGAFQEALS